jgi:hypothetical protein
MGALMLENPPLEEVYLEHFGVKGMKWGQKKASGSKQRRKAPSVKKTIAKGVAIGVVLTAGSYAVGRMLHGRVGRTKLIDIGFQNPGTIRVKSERLRPLALTAGKKRVEDLLYTTSGMGKSGFAFRNGQFVKI